MKKIIGKYVFLVFALLSSVWFVGCTENPAGSDGDDSAVSVDSTNASFVLVDSWQEGGTWKYTVRATGFFYPAASSPILVGIKDQNNWAVGNSGEKVGSNVWEFTISPGKGVKVFNFRDEDNWAQLPCLRNTGYYQPSLQGGNLAADFNDGKMSKIGGGSSGTRDTLVIIQRIINGVTVYDTIHRTDSTKTTDTVVVTLGDIIKTQGEPIDMGDGYWRNTILFSIPLVVVRDTSYRPFCIGLPSVQKWIKSNKRDLGKLTNGYYPLVVTLKAGERCKFGVGGDYDKAWADSASLKYWGVRTPDGIVGELFTDTAGHIFPGKLVSTSITPPVVIHDTLSVTKKDTVIVRFDRIIIDSVFIIKWVGGKTDTIKTSDTVPVFGDLVRVEKVTAVSGGYQLSLAFFSPLIRTVSNGKPFAIGLPKWQVYSLGVKRADWYYPVTTGTLAVGDTYDFNAGGDSSSSWADSSVVKTSIWAHKTARGWGFRGTMGNGKFVPTSLVPVDTADTIIIIPPDTADTIIIVPDTADTIIDKGTVIDSSKSFLRDTSWIDPDSLKGVVTEDTIVSTRSIHSYWIISARGDTTRKADISTVSNKIYRYKSDTLSFVIAQYGMTVVGVDTVYRFGITTKAFTYSGKNDDSVSLTGITDASKWKFVGKIGGYFVFDVKLVGGVTYSLNAFGNKGTWAQQEVLQLSPFAVRTGGNCDIVVKGDGVAGRLVKP